MGDYTSFLYARPSFLEGVARLLDFSGTLNEYNASTTPEQVDALALRSDLAAVGQDMWEAIEAFERELASAKAR